MPVEVEEHIVVRARVDLPDVFGIDRGTAGRHRAQSLDQGRFPGTSCPSINTSRLASECCIMLLQSGWTDYVLRFSTGHSLGQSVKTVACAVRPQ